jgi:hypothetical protein
VFDLIGFLLLLFIYYRVTALNTAAEVSHEEFMQLVAHTDEPAVVVEHRSWSWLLGAARNRYILVFRGHRIHTRAFKAIELPDDVIVIETRAL